MRKSVIALTLAATAVLGTLAAPRAEAQNYPQVKGLTAFTAATNYMSLPGYLRYRYFVESKGTWIDYEEATRIVAGQPG